MLYASERHLARPATTLRNDGSALSQHFALEVKRREIMEELAARFERRTIRQILVLLDL